MHAMLATGRNVPPSTPALGDELQLLQRNSGGYDRYGQSTASDPQSRQWSRAANSADLLSLPSRVPVSRRGICGSTEVCCGPPGVFCIRDEPIAESVALALRAESRPLQGGVSRGYR